MTATSTQRRNCPVCNRKDIEVLPDGGLAVHYTLPGVGALCRGVKR